MIEYLSAGIVLGLSAGFAPGPLLALVVSQTMAYGFRAGLMVCLAPLATDLPIIGVTLFLLGRFASSGPALGIISLCGAVLVMFLGIQSMRTGPIQQEVDGLTPGSLSKGILVNFFSPHPYLFWLSVGAPTVIKAGGQGIPAALSFVLGFYGFLIGSKIVLALIVSRSREFLSSKGYVVTMRILGLVLCGFALLLVRDGIRLLF